MAYSENFPTQRPIFSLDASNAGRLDPRCSFTRSDTPPTYAAPSAVHYWSNEKHLSSENLIINSDASDWYFPGAEYSKATGQTGPDGSADATKFTEKASGSREYKIQSGNFTPIANQEITYSVWLKQSSGSRDYQQVRVGNIGSGQAWATFNLTNGTVDQYGGALGVSASVNTGPTDWYQCVLRFTPTSTTALSCYIYAASASGGELPNVTGDTGNSYLLFGAQVSTTGETVVNETSGQIHRQYAPTLKSVSTAGQPRFEYSPTDSASDGQSMGILIEGSATNLIPNSSAINSWATVGDVTITDSAAVGPDGTLSASLVRPTTVNSYLHYVRETITTVASSSYTFSAYVKPAGYTKVQLFFYQTSSPYTTGAETIFTLTGSGSASTAVGSSTITAVGGGYYRISVTGVAGTTAAFAAIRLLDDSGSNEFVGDGYSGIICTGVQFELGSHPSSLISTSGSAVTRAAESLSVAAADIGYTGGPVSLFCDGTAQGENTGGGQVLFAVRKDDANRIGVWTRRTNKRIALVSGGGVSSSLEESSWYDGKTALSLTTDSFSGSINGRTVLTDTSQPLPDLNGATVYVGNLDSGTAYQMNGHVKRVALYGEALSDTNLQALTS